MTVLTNAVAAGTPGRLAPYRYTPYSIAVFLYHLETAGFEARFNGLTGDSLRQLEVDTRDTSAPSSHAEYLHDTLTAWKGAIEDFDRSVTDADYRAVAGLPWDHPRTIAYRSASSAMDTWHACREKLHAAFIDWSLDLTGTIDVPEPAGLDPVVVADGHRVPDCTGHCAADGCCSAEIGSINVDHAGELVVELYADEGDQPTGVVYTFDADHDGTLLRTTNPAELRRKADEFYRFAGRIEQAAHVLDQLQQREAK